MPPVNGKLMMLHADIGLGDVFSYALAKVRGLPLLVKGDDFALTDVRQALERSSG